MDDFRPSAFTPFLRRFTDERARDLVQLRALYQEVRGLHFASKYAEPDAIHETGYTVYCHFRDLLPAALKLPFDNALENLMGLETTIFAFPDIKWDIAQLSLKEQVDLERFLTAKRHFLKNEERVIDFLQGGLYHMVDTITKNLPEFSGPSPFTIPLINVIPDVTKALDRLYRIVWLDSYIDNGLFVSLRNQMHLNICAASGIADPDDPKRPYRLPSQHDAPVSELVDIYFKNTALAEFLIAPVPLKLTHEDRFSHMHIVGGSGAGKTQLLQHLILHDLQSDDPPSLVIVDSQGDLINKLSRLGLFDPDTGPLANRLVLITPKDIEYPPAINLFALNRDRLGKYDEVTKEQVTAGVIQTFDYLFAGLLGADLTAKQSVFFRFVARLMLTLPETMGRNATILDMIALMDDAGPYKLAIERLPPIQRTFFERDFASKTFVQTKEQIRYRLNAILENPTLARLFTAPETKIDFFDTLNRGGIILIDTAKDFLKGSSDHFGRLLISMVLQAVLERAVIPEHQRRPTFLIVDEAASYFDSNIDDLLTEARKYKCGCVFAHQFLDQATSALRASLAANTGIKMASGVSSSDARALAPDMRTTADAILAQTRLQFACYVRNVTQSAVSAPIVAGELERQPKLDQGVYLKLQQRNRQKVSGHDAQQSVRTGPSMGGGPSTKDQSVSTPVSDPTMPSGEW